VDDVRAFFAILAVLRQVRPDIVHTHMAKAGVVGRLATVVYNRTFGRARPAQIVHTYHGHVLEGYFSRAASRIFVALERQLGRHTDALIAISPRIRTELVERFHVAAAERFRTISLGFELSSLLAIDEVSRARARASLDLPPRTLVLTAVGRLTAIKNLGALIDAAEGVTAAFPDVVLLIVGDGELRDDLQQRAARLGSRVRFLGWRRDLATIYGASDVFVLTSRNEGTPVALIEAMASALPTVSTEVGGVADVVTDETMGLLVPSGDASALGAAIVRLLSSPEVRREMGARARASVAARYDLGRLLADIDALYRDLLRSRPSCGP
jgi:glycosyltransferase involved in cell wall biosynthesis